MKQDKLIVVRSGSDIRRCYKLVDKGYILIGTSNVEGDIVYHFRRTPLTKLMSLFN